MQDVFYVQRSWHSSYTSHSFASCPWGEFYINLDSPHIVSLFLERSYSIVEFLSPGDLLGVLSLLLNDKEFCFSLIGLNSIFSTLPQSEYTSRAVSISRVQWAYLAWGIFGLVSIFVYCLFGVSTLSNQRRDFISNRPIKLQKKVKIFKNFKISKFYKIYKNFKNFIIYKFQNL
jgi:hypothetical protein